MDSKICVYTICKNESKNILTWFEPLKTADVICVLDTGSTDESLEIWNELMKSYPNLHVKQELFSPFYFDVARNTALDYLREFASEGDICFHFDLDEEAEPNFLEEAKKQCDNPSIEKFVAFDQDGGSSWKGHRLLNNLRWRYHIHEKVMRDDNQQTSDIHIYNTSYTHHQDKTKPRDYLKILRKVSAEDPHCIHYLTYLLVEECMLQNNLDKRNEIIKKIAKEVFDNVEDEHYLDCSWLAYALSNWTGDIHYAIEQLEHARSIIDSGLFYDFKLIHELLAKGYKQASNIKDAEKEFYACIKAPKAKDDWVDFNIRDEDLLLELELFYFYDKKDYICASHYAQVLNNQNPTEINKYNLKCCIDNMPERKSWVLLLCDNTYILGVLGTIYTLRETKTKHPITVVVTKDIDLENIKTLVDLDVHILLLDKITPQNRKEVTVQWYNLEQDGYHAALSKIYIFDLIEFEKIVYIDSDTWVLTNMDELFDYPSLSAVPDVYGNSKDFCSGLLVIEPNTDLFNDILEVLNSEETQKEHMLHDQLILQAYFKENYVKLPPKYHLWSSYCENGELETYSEYFFHKTDVKAYHIIDRKPWTTTKQYYLDISQQYPVYSSIVLRYIWLLNHCISIVEKAGIKNKYLKYIK